MNPPPKSILKSKSALAGAITAIVGALGSFSPGASEFVTTHANTILMGVGLLNIILRAVTRGRVVLFAE